MGTWFSPAVLDTCDDVGNRSRTYYSQRSHFVDAGVCCVHLDEDVIAADFTVQLASQIGLDSFSFLIHGLRGVTVE